MDARDGEAIDLKQWLWGIRRRVNLLLAEGHPDAWLYPLGLLYDECVLAVERKNAQIVAEAIGFRTAYISARIADGQKLMGDFINSLAGE